MPEPNFWNPFSKLEPAVWDAEAMASILSMLLEHGLRPVGNGEVHVSREDLKRIMFAANDLHTRCVEARELYSEAFTAWKRTEPTSDQPSAPEGA